MNNIDVDCCNSDDDDFAGVDNNFGLQHSYYYIASNKDEDNLDNKFDGKHVTMHE